MGEQLDQRLVIGRKVFTVPVEETGNGQLTVSSLFDWYREDFAPDDKTLVKLFAHYKDDLSALYLLGFDGDIKYNYNWALNSAE